MFFYQHKSEHGDWREKLMRQKALTFWLEKTKGKMERSKRCWGRPITKGFRVIEPQAVHAGDKRLRGRVRGNEAGYGGATWLTMQAADDGRGRA